MRWSTPSFGLGLGVGLLAALALGVGGGRAEREPYPSTHSERTPSRGPSSEAARGTPAATRDGFEAGTPLTVWTRSERRGSRGLTAGAEPIILRGMIARARGAWADSSINDMSRIDWERAWRAAEEWGIEAGSPARSLVTKLLGSADGEDVLLGLGLAARSRPPMLDLLCRAAGDPGFGSFRAVAVVALAHHRDGGEEVLEAFLSATRDPEEHVRRTAVGLISHFGALGAPAARRLLRSGEYADEERAALVAAAILGDRARALDLAMSGPDPEVLAALLSALKSEVSGKVAVAVIRRVLGSPVHAELGVEIMAVAAANGLVEVLEEIAMSPNLPRSTRLSAVHLAVTAPAAAERAPDIVARLLADADTPAPMVRDLLARVDEATARTSRIQGTLWSLSRRHPNPGVREAARQKLQLIEPGDLGGLAITSATYGKGDHILDVRDALSGRIALGRLTVRSVHEIVGDPIYGTVKDLIVTYTYQGRRHTRTVRDGQVLSIP
jgi:DnaJ-like protein C11, C-terminal